MLPPLLLPLLLLLLLLSQLSPPPVAAAGEAGCGRKSIAHHEGNGFIVGGRDARPGSWPWQAQLLFRGSHRCGGSLIASRWVLTAAHCLAGWSTQPQAFVVALGSHSKLVRDRRQVDVVPDSIFMHPRYNPSFVDYDIALLRLPRPVAESERVAAACVSPDAPPPGSMCYATGWGETLGTGHEEVLKQAQVPLIDFARCQQLYANSLTPRMMCAGSEAGGIDACKGDSGGPLSCLQRGLWHVTGAVSWGLGCALPGFPGIYANVSNFHSWISGTISSNS